MPTMRRRDWLAGAAAALAFRPRDGRAAAESAPGTIEEALNQLETLMSPEALAGFYARPEDDAHELHGGVRHIYRLRGWAPLDYGEPIPSLAARLKELRVPARVHYLYVITALWRRKHALSLDAPRVLDSIERQERLQAEKIAAWERTSGRQVTDDRMSLVWIQVFHFDEDSVRPRPNGDALDYIVKATQGPTSICALTEAQGHAGQDEPDARALSLVRARAVVDRLLRKGVDPARLSAHGLGARFPVVRGARSPERDRRVEVFCLRRHWVPPLVYRPG